MPEFGRVDVQSIHSEVSRSTLSESDIEQLADAILANGGLLQPLILKQTSVESFLVLEGHFEFYSAVRAREKNPRQGEMVNAFVLSSSEEATALEQIKLLRKQIDTSPPVIPPATVPDSSGLAPWITSFEMRLSEIRELIFQNQQVIDLRLKKLEEESIKPLPPLEKLTVAQLKKLAQERGLTGSGTMKKKDWVDLLSQP
ncbi:MAG: chromosome partitioning protein ParB [Cyanobacteriota bacterium]|nr:chromosome partitioning protein ParB [Cyanobacteriota bacterium]